MVKPSSFYSAITQPSWSTRAAVALSAACIYALVFPAAYAATSVIAASLSVIPIALAGWLFGRRGGVLAGLLSVPLHILLFNVAGASGWRVVLQQWPGSILGIVLGLVAGWLSEFLRQVQDQARDLARERAALRAEIDERERVEHDLQQAKAAAEAADRAKSSFLANASHELRTPLTAILGYSELLALNIESGDLSDLGADIAKVRSAGLQLLALIDDVLDLSKIEAGRMELSIEIFDLSSLIREVSETTQPLFARNRNRFCVCCSAGRSAIRMDRTKLRQVLLNLLSNAAKFTKDGAVTLTIEHEPAEAKRAGAMEWYIFRVHDTGIGMTDQQIERIFQPFVQAEPSIARKYGGTGLGLALSQRLCQLMGGTLAASSVMGEGSTFTVRLPSPRRSIP